MDGQMLWAWKTLEVTWQTTQPLQDFDFFQAVSDAKGGTVYRDHLPHLGESGSGGLLGATAGATSATQASMPIGKLHYKWV